MLPTETTEKLTHQILRLIVFYDLFRPVAMTVGLVWSSTSSRTKARLDRTWLFSRILNMAESSLTAG